MHTYKGLSRGLGLNTLASHIHQWEQNSEANHQESLRILEDQANLYIKLLGLDQFESKQVF